jgi:hypothetical protein
MFGDPEYFDIEQRKLFGIWPHDQLISKGMNPYVRRLKHDRIAMLIVGDLKGESIYGFLSENPKIIKMNVVNVYDQTTEQLKSVYDKNTNTFTSKLTRGISRDKKRDVVCIDSISCTVDNLELYYQNTKSGSIFCGNGHDTQTIKDILNQFRRKNRIGTPMLVCDKTVWFWYVR